MSKVNLPNAERAFIDMRKLRDYALDSDHRVGKHKASLFAAFLGMSKDDADILREILLQAAQTNDAIIGIQDEHGQRYNEA